MILIITFFSVTGESCDDRGTRKIQVFRVRRCHGVFVSIGKVSKGDSYLDVTNTATEMYFLQHFENLDYQD